MDAAEHRDVERLLLLMAEVGQRVTATLAEATGGTDLTSNAAVYVLAALDLDGPLRPGDVSELTGLSSAGTTGLLDRLQHLGLVERSTGVPGDRRGVYVRVTPQGRRMLRRMTAAVRGEIEKMQELIRELHRLSDRPVRLP